MPTPAHQPPGAGDGRRHRRFDHVVVVDWSAASTPSTGTDSIWIAHLEVGHGTFGLCNPRTRHEARLHLEGLLLGLGSDARLLLGIDVSLGYPAGFAAAAGLVDRAPSDMPPWSATWQHLATSIVDDERNRNNRWAVAADLNRRLGTNQFWGTPAAHAGEHLTATKPSPTRRHLPERRRVEDVLVDRGHRPFSAWQLLGTGSVGSQSLTAIPVLHRLRTHPGLAARFAVWPFEPARADIVVAEVWPSMLDATQVDAEPHEVRDARQVLAMARHLAEAQRRGRLGAWLDAPSLLAEPAAVAAVADEEGWVLGLG